MAKSVSEIEETKVVEARIAQLERENRELAFMNQLIRACSAFRRSAPMLQMACTELAGELGAYHVVAVLLDEKETRAHIVAEHVEDGRLSMRGMWVNATEHPLLARLLECQEPLLVTAVPADPRMVTLDDMMRRWGIDSLLLLPLWSGGKAVGVLALACAASCRFTADDVQLAWRAAQHVAQELSRTWEDEQRQQLFQAEKLQAVGRLASGIAHDFNNLLTTINGFASLIQMELPEGDPIGELAHRILSSGKRAADLTRQLLAFSRKQVMEPEVLDLNAVVAKMSPLLQRLVGERVDLKAVLGDNLWSVEADPIQIERVIVHLASNACDAMPEGGRLVLHTSNERLGRSSPWLDPEAQPGDYVMLVVSDTGTGMSDRVVDHLFEPFFTTKDVGRGTGLGLATVYGIVKQSGGWTRVSSVEGGGTEFRVYLPRVDQAKIHRGTAQAFESPEEVGSETILLVDDNIQVRELTSQILKGYGYSLLQAGDGCEASKLAQEYSGPIHLLLTDVLMPGINGRDLADRITRTRPGLKVLFMSSYTDGLVGGTDITLLQKPFSPMGLVYKVRAALDG